MTAYQMNGVPQGMHQATATYAAYDQTNGMLGKFEIFGPFYFTFSWVHFGSLPDWRCSYVPPFAHHQSNNWSFNSITDFDFAFLFIFIQLSTCKIISNSKKKLKQKMIMSKFYKQKTSADDDFYQRQNNAINDLSSMQLPSHMNFPNINMFQPPPMTNGELWY